ncbi:MAG: hypothetical protein M0C28_12515 [Candidatus Moduliflexus flocculans]|nr:hypothetical protein [Candidatus Moduliflexus flocculans]
MPVILAILAAATALVYTNRPDKAFSILFVSKDYLLEMLSVLPRSSSSAACSTPGSRNRRSSGSCKASGARGAAISFLLGTAAMGPLYAAFPIGKALLDKGASLYNVAVFSCVWASIKIPMILFEVKFMGAEFASSCGWP